jgi:hypothetical protein
LEHQLQTVFEYRAHHYGADQGCNERGVDQIRAKVNHLVNIPASHQHGRLQGLILRISGCKRSKSAISALKVAINSASVKSPKSLTTGLT